MRRTLAVVAIVLGSLGPWTAVTTTSTTAGAATPPVTCASILFGAILAKGEIEGIAICEAPHRGYTSPAPTKICLQQSPSRGAGGPWTTDACVTSNGRAKKLEIPWPIPATPAWFRVLMTTPLYTIHSTPEHYG
jgi:hypothetical protein